MGNKKEEWKKVADAFRNMKPLYGLISLPAGDGNYQSSLREASIEDLSTAITVMQAFPEGNMSRIATCQKRLNELMAG